MDNVEIYNCSQYDTFKAAIRFERARVGPNVISNSAIHHGLGIGAQLNQANNLTLVNNTIFDFAKYGINIVSSSNIVVDGNIVADINARVMAVTSNLLEITAGILGCALYERDQCQNVFILNNIVAGTSMTGYSV